MSDDMTGAMTPSVSDDTAATTASTPLNSAASNGAAPSAPAGDAAETAPVTPVVAETPADAPAAPDMTASAPTDAVSSDAGEEADTREFAQMPPLDEIEVPGGEDTGSGQSSERGGRSEGGRGRGRRGNNGGDRPASFGDSRYGNVVTGEVVKIDNEGVLVDVGMKSEGLIRPNELSREPVADINEVVKIGDKIDVFVMEPERDGILLLSKKRADFEKSWVTVQDAMGDGRTLQAVVLERVRGGLVVDLGIRGFVPASHVGSGKLKNLDKYVGTTIPLKVLEVDRNARKVVLSHRLATEEERQREKEETIAALGEGQIKTGTIRRVTDYGAFVDLGGIDGLLHVSEMSWTRVRHPSDVVKVGDQVQVVILKMNLDQGRVSLGMRQILPDPWEAVGEKYHVGDTVEGEITRLVPFGAFVRLDSEIEGIVPNNELAHRRVMKPADVVEQGQMVQVKVIDVRPDERRLTLSLRALQPREAGDDYRERAPRAPSVPGAAPAPDDNAGGGARREKRERRGGRGRDDEGEGDYRQYMASTGGSSGGFGSGSGVTLGDIFGDMLSGAGSGKSGKGGGKRGSRRRNEEEDDDLSDLDDLDMDVSADETEDAETK